MKTIKTTFKNIYRHKFIAIGTIITIALVIMIFNILQAISLKAQDYLTQMDSKIEFQIFLDQKTPTNKINQIQDIIQSQPNITSSELVTPNIALEQVNEYYPKTVEILKSMAISNPLPYSIKYKSTNLASGQQILEQIKQSQFKEYFVRDNVKNKNQETISQVVNKILIINKVIDSITKLLIISFLISSTIIIFTSIKTSLQNRRKELVIMKFMGANLKAIKSPYILEGVIIGILSTTLGIGFFMSLEYLTSFNLNYTPTQINILTQLTATTIIGYLCSKFTTNKHLNTLPIHIDE
ncbi:MAG: cell division protein FtsX [Crocinitomicaceae bacterium]